MIILNGGENAKDLPWKSDLTLQLLAKRWNHEAPKIQ